MGILEFLAEQVVEAFVQWLFPGIGKVVVTIYELFGLAELISNAIEKIRFARSIPGVVCGLLEFCFLAAIPVLFMVMAFNILLRLVRKYLQA